jgi:hypothetical protein
MKLIPLTNSDRVAVVDDEDFERISAFRWREARPPGGALYAVRPGRPEDGTKVVAMHREVMGCRFGDGKTVDHADRDGLNNRRSNLRVCTQAENLRNRAGSSLSRTGFKGVRISRATAYGKRYYAEIKANGQKHHLGSFETVEQAHAAYVAAAHRLHGEFARAG